jgi:hypothetical protein
MFSLFLHSGTGASEFSEAPVFLVSLDVEINPRFYRGKKKERSYNKTGEAKLSPRRL